MEPIQAERVEAVYAELKNTASLLHHKIMEDLTSGSVKMGTIVRKNPPVPGNELEEAMSEMYVGLCRLPWPWYWNGDETTANIMACKAVALQVLTRRRQRANRYIIEADLNHRLLIEGNALVVDTNQHNEYISELQDLFLEEQKLDPYDNKLVPKDPDRKTLTDYRNSSPIRAKCHPEQGHYIRGWCQPCGSSLLSQYEKIPPYSTEIVVPKRNYVKGRKKPATSVVLNHIAATRGMPKPKAYDCYEDCGFWGPEHTREWFRTSRLTMPINGNPYKHASFIRRLNTLAQEGKLNLWKLQILSHNQSVAGQEESDE